MGVDAMAVVLITGCSSGIGLEAALAFARRGDRVHASMRNPAKADRLRGRLAAEGLSVEIVELDVVDDTSVAVAVAAIEEEHGAIDVVVNNAGIGFGGPVEEIDIERARAVMETNFWGALRVIRAALPAMRARRQGVIVNVTSVAGRVPGTAYNSIYGASKHALGTLSEGLHMELEPWGVRVHTIEPGFFATDIFTNGELGHREETSDYAADQKWVDDFYLVSGEQGGADPAIVADVIVKVAGDPAAPLHHLVGDDAMMFVDLVNQAGTFEGWIPVATSIVESVSGPRPPAPGPS
jgi:NAD(P)-dependent dehydrogenase (short-subunit alcohol dehydrogenase family)